MPSPYTANTGFACSTDRLLMAALKLLKLIGYCPPQLMLHDCTFPGSRNLQRGLGLQNCLGHGLATVTTNTRMTTTTPTATIQKLKSGLSSFHFFSMIPI